MNQNGFWKRHSLCDDLWNPFLDPWNLLLQCYRFLFFLLRLRNLNNQLFLNLTFVFFSVSFQVLIKFYSNVSYPTNSFNFHQWISSGNFQLVPIPDWETVLDVAIIFHFRYGFFLVIFMFFRRLGFVWIVRRFELFVA